ncbi:hypothetical protein LDENG_00209530 [Lucifuga dentata]|nr:hypothetical protein LDENG_00209530 [Lucifuga dentata]
MFAAETKALVNRIGASTEVIPNKNLNKKMDLLTIVKVKQNTLLPNTYEELDFTLLDLMNQPESSDYELPDEVVVEDYRSWNESSGRVSVEVTVPDKGSVCWFMHQGLQKTDSDLKPLADLPVSVHHDLLQKLCEIVDEQDALNLLDKTMDEWIEWDCGLWYDCPQSQSVSSFLDLLKDSLTPQKKAIHLLVCTMTTLPDSMAALLANCSHDTLRRLNQLVDSLMTDGQAHLSESLPSPLQEGGELSWIAELLCSTNNTLRELNEMWEETELEPGVLLSLLCVATRGLSMMQP